MSKPTFDFQKKLEPVQGVILFFVILLVANIFWKFDVLGDESTTGDSMVTFWGFNISAPFVWMAHHVAHATTAILHFFGSSASLKTNNLIRFPNGNSVYIIWACTGMKQAYICFCILAFSRGPWMKKAWFIPLSLAVVYLFNIFRITFIVACIENHPTWFHFLHVYVFKYIFYGVIFLMWVYWEEKIAGKKQVKASTRSRVQEL